MIKRSLLWVLAAYCIGIVFRDRLKLILWVVLFSYAFLGLCRWKRIAGWHLDGKLEKLQSVVKKEKILVLILPAAFLLGAVLGKMQEAEYPIDSVLVEKTAAVAEGRIRSVREAKSGWRLELSHVTIGLQETTEMMRSEKEHEKIQKEENGRVSNEQEQKENCNDTKGKLLVYCESAESLRIGNYIRLEGKAVPFAEPENLGQFDEKSYYRAERMCCKFNAEKIEILDDGTDKIREWCRGIRNRLDSTYEEILPEKHAGIVSAILLGDKTELDTDTKELYQKNGIAHILAISGLHVSLLGMGLFTIIRKIGSPLIPAAAVTMLMLLFYGGLTEFVISTQRAVGMLVIAMLAKILGRSYDSRSACALCGLMILIVNPLQLLQTGFQLSFAAAFGISYFGQELDRMKLNRGKTVFEKIVVTLLSGVTTQLITAPILLDCFYEIPVYSVFLNLPVIGLLSFMVFLSILAGLAGIISYPLGKFLAGGVYLILELYEKLCELAEKLPFPIWLYGKPQVRNMAMYFIVLVLFFVVAEELGQKYRHHPGQHRYRRHALLVLCLLSLAFVRRQGSVAGENGMVGKRICTVDFLSVGQGDCSVIRTKNGNTYLIDCGSSDVKSVGEYRLEPWLKYHGISTLEAVFLTHPDSDHTNGVTELLENANSPDDWYRGEIQIKNLVLPTAYRNETGFVETARLAEEKNIPILWFDTGDAVAEDGIRLICLHPDKEYPVYDTNDASMVLRLESEKASVLFTGDVGTSGEEKLIQKPIKKELSVLKVAHHGSKNSSSESFLDMVQPDVAVISCGKNNRFGHPHPETLQRLQDSGSKITVTAQQGTVTVEINENDYRVRCYKAE